MNMPDLPKDIYFALMDLKKDTGLTQWQLLILGVWATRHMSEVMPDTLRQAVDNVSIKYPKPEARPRTSFKGKLPKGRGA